MMSKVNDSDEVIRLASFMYGFNPDKQPWDGDAFGFEEPLKHNGVWSGASLCLRQARALVAEAAVVASACRTLPSMWEVHRSPYAKRED